MIATAGGRTGALIGINGDVAQNQASSKSIGFHQFNMAWVLNGAGEP